MPNSSTLWRILPGAAALGIVATGAHHAQAGMPPPLPVLKLTDLARDRIDAISFFLVAMLLSAAAIQWLWNFLRRDFSRLPRLSYLRSVALTLVWGLLFTLVLTMISGARELMTPGAWERNGGTYRLKNAAPPAPPETPAPEQSESDSPHALIFDPPTGPSEATASGGE